MNKDVFKLEVEKLGINITDDHMKKLEIYKDFLLYKNKEFNLTAITEHEKIYLKHFFDSLTLIKVVNLSKEKTLCDFGSGAGFPGIVLKIFYNNLDITLIESSQKKCRFLEEVIEKLELKNIKVICERMEKHKDKYDVIVCRGVSKLSIISEIVTNNIKEKGCFIAMKGKPEELNNSQKLEILGMRIEKVINFKLPIEESDRSLIKIKKEKNSKKGFPREYNKIKSNPLF